MKWETLQYRVESGGDREYRITKSTYARPGPDLPPGVFNRRDGGWILTERRWSTEGDDFEWKPVKPDQFFLSLNDAKRAAELRAEMSDVDEEYAALTEAQI